MDADAKTDATPEAFLDVLGKNLTEMTDTDTELAAILRDHILKVTPAKDAVATAKVAIAKLAADRATPPKKAPADG